MTTHDSTTSLSADSKATGRSKTKSPAKRSSAKQELTVVRDGDEGPDDDDAPPRPAKPKQITLAPLSKIISVFKFDKAVKAYRHKTLALGFFCLEPVPSNESSWNGGDPVEIGPKKWGQKLADTFSLSSDPEVLKAQANLYHDLKEAFGEELRISTYSLADVVRETIVDGDSPAYPLLVEAHNRLAAEPVKAAPVEAPVVDEPTPALEDKGASIVSIASETGAIVEPTKPAQKAQAAKVSKKLTARIATREEIAAPKMEPLQAAPAPNESAAAEKSIEPSTPPADGPVIEPIKEPAPVDLQGNVVVEYLRRAGCTTPAELLAWARSAALIPAAPPPARSGESRTRYGVIDHLAELAQRSEGVTIKEAAELLAVRFPERDASSMAQTCKIQLGGKGDKAGSRLGQDRRLTIRFADDPVRGRVIYGTPKASA